MTEASEEIDRKIAGIGDWRGTMLGDLRSVIRSADPDIVEEIKWRKPSNPSGVPVWSLDGMICTGEVYKSAVKLTFANGASLDDPAKLFNASLAGDTRRAIDFAEGDKIDEGALANLVREAIAFNRAKGRG
jgi:hypothetical protein